MRARTRLLLLLVLVVSFFVIAPWLVFYSLGYRVDIENREIVSTGGIYVRTQPPASNIIIDEEIIEAPGIFSNSVFVQNLTPGYHSVSVSKSGYFDYNKTLMVIQKEVTKLENVVLFSKSISFELMDKRIFEDLIKKPAEIFVIKNNNLYYSNAPENSRLTILQKNSPLLRGVAAFSESTGKIIWLGIDGFLKTSDISSGSTEIMNKSALMLDLGKSYSFKIFGQSIFLKAGTDLLMLNQEEKLFDEIYRPVTDLKVSPDGQKVIYFNNHEIFIYYLGKPQSGFEKNSLLKKSDEKINDVNWMGSNYIVFSKNDRVEVCEVDARGNVNSITLSDAITLPLGESITIKNPEIFFDQPSRRLYILTQNQLISSDKLLP